MIELINSDDETELICVLCGKIKPLSQMKGGYKRPICKTHIFHNDNEVK